MTTKIIIRYEISTKTVKEEFINNGVFYTDANYDRWLELETELSVLTKDERQVIWDNCIYEGANTFRYDKCYINTICESVSELVKIINDK